MAANTSTNTSPTSVFGAGNLRNSLAQATDPGNSSFNARATPVASLSQQPSSPSVTVCALSRRLSEAMSSISSPFSFREIRQLPSPSRSPRDNHLQNHSSFPRLDRKERTTLHRSRSAIRSQTTLLGRVWSSISTHCMR